jgi:hypothetical protein
MEENSKLPMGIQTFSDIRKGNFIYVDKTAYIAKMIDEATKTWFLARPRRFGKSLFLSTIASLFEGQKEHFQGLAIEKRLDEELFAQPPVIHLDMSAVEANQGGKIFDSSLVNQAILKADSLKVDLPKNMPAKDTLNFLIVKTALKYGKNPAILIDEYDAPVTDLWDKPHEMEEIRSILRKYYACLKANDKFISFVFVTGITKAVKGGLYSGFNNPTDISYDPEYGTVTGFTYDEILLNFEKKIKETADFLNKTPESLLKDMKDYYNGFCFDSKTYVYNPISVMSLFKNKKFGNFWFETATPKQLISFLEKSRFPLEYFHKLSVRLDNITSPTFDRFREPEIYLFQLGYLSICPGESKEENKVILDYPNKEVIQSLSRSIMQSVFNLIKTADDVSEAVLKALEGKNPGVLIKQINKLFSKLPYDDQGTKLKPRDEGFYRSQLFTLFYGLDQNPGLEIHGNWGRSDITVSLGDVTWVFELKYCPKKSDKIKLAEEAYQQIIKKNYTGSYDNPIPMVLVVTEEKRLIEAWRSRDGVFTVPEEDLLFAIDL